MKKTVLLTSTGDVLPNGYYQHQLYRNYGDGVNEIGMFPMLYLDQESPAWFAQNLDALLLSGGEDIEPTRYNRPAHPQLGRLNPYRDQAEWALLEAFVAAKKPVFGICRGLQVINTFFGGTLYQDLPDEKGVHHTDGVRHSVLVQAGTRLRSYLPETLEVNSFHHQSIQQVGNGLKATAHASDGIVEAIEHETLPILAVQWHPERLTKEASCQLDLFRSLMGQ